MTNEKMRVKIAELLGFKWFAWINTRFSFPLSMNSKATFETLPSFRFLALWDDAHPHPKCSTQCFTEEEFALPMDDDCFRFVPNYPSSLDACAEFEKGLTDMQWVRYLQELASVVKLPKQAEIQIRQYVHATAPQRCEAFLRVNGAWEETE
jgi:hypothetical protein